MNARLEALAAHKRQDPLVKLYEDAWARVVAEQERLAGDPARTARLNRLLAMRDTIEAEMDRLDARTVRWYERGMFADPYLSGFQFTASPSEPINRRAALRLADNLFDHLLHATRFVRADTKRLIRDAARIAAQSTVVEETAPGAARKMMKDLLDNHGIKAVRYANGTKHGLADYADMAIRTESATAFNLGSLDGAPEVEWWQVWDGPDCGWSSHDDFRLANGLIVTRAEAQEFPISHPRCRRAVGPRPDVTSKTAAKREQAPKNERQDAALHAVG